MTDPRQTARASATSARSKTFTTADPRVVRLEVTGPVHVVVDSASAPRRWITGHGIGWLIGVLVGLAALWTVFHR